MYLYSSFSASDSSSDTDGFPGISDDIYVDLHSKSMMETNKNCDDMSLFDGNDHHETQHEFSNNISNAVRAVPGENLTDMAINFNHIKVILYFNL